MGTVSPLPQNSTPGSRAIDYLSPEDVLVEQNLPFATTSTQVLENYPIIGNLFQRKGESFRFICTYTESKPGRIEEIEQSYGVGKYQLRFMVKENVESISFTLKGQQQPDDLATESAERKIQNLKDRLDERDNELDQKQRKIRDLNNEIIEADRKAKAFYQTELKELENKLEEVKSRNTELERQVFTLELNAKFADREGDTGVFDFIERALNNENLAGVAQALLSRIGANAGNPAYHPPALPLSPNPSESVDESLSEIPMNTQPVVETQQDAQTILNDVVQQILNFGATLLVQDSPDLNTIKPTIDRELNRFLETGNEFAPQNWIMIATSLAQVAVERSVSPERLADVVSPLLDNMSAAKQVLKISPVDIALNQLVALFKIQLSNEQQDMLKKVLTIFKSRI